jgi:hypothetical protein
VFDPTRARIDLLVFFLRASDDLAIRIKDGETGTGRTLVNCSDVVTHGDIVTEQIGGIEWSA